MNVIVINVREAAPQGFTKVYVGRAMPGREGSVFGNPLPVIGKRWTHEAEHWTRLLCGELDEHVRQTAELALARKGYQQGDAAHLYRFVLRELCRTRAPQFDELMRLAQRVANAEALALACWCSPAPCHAEVVREAVLGYAARLVKPA